MHELMQYNCRPSFFFILLYTQWTWLCRRCSRLHSRTVTYFLSCG